MSQTPLKSLRVLVIADPGQPSRRIAAIKNKFEDLLQQAFEVDTRVESSTKTLRIRPNHDLEFTALDAIVEDYPDADVVLILTAIPRHTQGKPLVAEVLSDRKVAIVSYPTLGAVTTKHRLLKILMSCANQLLPFGPSTQDHPYMPRWGQWSGSGTSGQKTLHAHTFTGGPRLVMGMTMANEPLRMAPKLSGALAAASATGAFGIFYNSIWLMSNHLSTLRLISIGLGAITLMTGWLITTHHLWDKPNKEHLAPVVLYYNLSTVLTMLFCMAVLYVLLVVGILLGSLVVIDPDFMSQILKVPKVGLTNYLDIAWLSAALGALAGALGSSFDSDLDVKNLTHAQRLRMRVYTEEDGDVN